MPRQGANFTFSYCVRERVCVLAHTQRYSRRNHENCEECRNHHIPIGVIPAVIRRNSSVCCGPFHKCTCFPRNAVGHQRCLGSPGRSSPRVVPHKRCRRRRQSPFEQHAWSIRGYLLGQQLCAFCSRHLRHKNQGSSTARHRMQSVYSTTASPLRLPRAALANLRISSLSD